MCSVVCASRYPVESVCNLREGRNFYLTLCLTYTPSSVGPLAGYAHNIYHTLLSCFWAVRPLMRFYALLADFACSRRTPAAAAKRMHKEQREEPKSTAVVAAAPAVATCCIIGFCVCFPSKNLVKSERENKQHVKFSSPKNFSLVFASCWETCETRVEIAYSLQHQQHLPRSEFDIGSPWKLS